MAIEEQLQKAISSGESIEIIYHGGSQPGTNRTISPISLNNDKVRARCHSSNAVKTFIINKMTVVNGNEATESPKWSTDFKAVPRHTSLSDILETNINSLINLGWHINSDENSITLHRRFKNGNPMKGSDVSLNYDEFSYDVVMNEDGEYETENKRKSTRPWCVRGKKETTRSYAKLDSAADTFLSWAQGLSPLKK